MASKGRRVVGISLRKLKIVTVWLSVAALFLAAACCVFLRSSYVRQSDIKALETSETPFIKGSRKPRGIIYNRVGKCGSRSFLQLMHSLARENGFNMLSIPNNGTLKVMSLRAQLDMVMYIDEQVTPFIYSKHFHFIDFKRFGSVHPIHINLIRDPLSRMVSNYYFSRFGDGRGSRSWLSRASKRRMNMTFDECVLSHQPECVNPNTIFYIIPYFCGQIRKCGKPSHWSLQEAISNVSNKYLIVGILEEFEDFLKVLEKLLPQFFKGASKKWKNPTSDEVKKRRTTQTKYKKPPSAKVVKIMKEKLKMEYKLYQFVKHQFHNLKDELGVVDDDTEKNKFGAKSWNQTI